ncbi:hypothetical protein IFM89_004763 [Coptis chinensis]|uniref:Calmodulin-binding protein n=1 Tax=Coptis chinensis TaxID=261450 RepID=A0A835HI94_9MAGN|nr:hypothetical protein IFM89_004763 [Coptis chinensis]
MEVIISVLPTDFNFDSACSTPFISAPASPKPFGELYFSAPTSPIRISAIYRDFNNISFVQRTSCDGSSLDWQEKIGTEPKSNDTHRCTNEDFAFDFSGQLDKTSLTADELFDGGKIRPLEIPSRSQTETQNNSPVSSPTKEERGRGRERVAVFSSSSSKHRSTRSFSPLRLSEFAWEEQQQQSTEDIASNSKPTSTSFFAKWSFKLLFRSASEGSATNKNHPLKKHTALWKKHEDVSRNASFRSSGSGSGSSSLSGSRRKGPLSAHELHYTSNRAVQNELKRKTFLPYKKGLLGCVGFSPSVDGLARGLNSIKRG